jgi:hypothetical protein
LLRLGCYAWVATLGLLRLGCYAWVATLGSLRLALLLLREILKLTLQLNMLTQP